MIQKISEGRSTFTTVNHCQPILSITNDSQQAATVQQSTSANVIITF